MTAAALLRGYQKGGSEDGGSKQQAAILSASIADMGAIRHNSDCVARLSANVEELTDALRDHTHYTRNMLDTLTEQNRQAREMASIMDRLIRAAGNKDNQR